MGGKVQSGFELGITCSDTIKTFLRNSISRVRVEVFDVVDMLKKNSKIVSLYLTVRLWYHDKLP